MFVVSNSVVARSNTILKQLVLQAKREYEAEAVHRVQIYFADSYVLYRLRSVPNPDGTTLLTTQPVRHGSWRWTDSRHKRPMSSIVLNPGVKEMLLADARDFLRSEKVIEDFCLQDFVPNLILFSVVVC
jgi:chaperone BCS1